MNNINYYFCEHVVDLLPSFCFDYSLKGNALKSKESSLYQLSLLARCHLSQAANDMWIAEEVQNVHVFRTEGANVAVCYETQICNPHKSKFAGSRYNRCNELRLYDSFSNLDDSVSVTNLRDFFTTVLIPMRPISIELTREDATEKNGFFAEVLELIVEFQVAIPMWNINLFPPGNQIATLHRCFVLQAQLRCVQKFEFGATVWHSHSLATDSLGELISQPKIRQLHLLGLVINEKYIDKLVKTWIQHPREILIQFETRCTADTFQRLGMIAAVDSIGSEQYTLKHPSKDLELPVVVTGHYTVWGRLGHN